MDDEKPLGWGVEVHTGTITIPFYDTSLIDMASLEGPQIPPPSRGQRWARNVFRRYWGLRWRLAEVIAGQSLDDY